MLPTLRPVTRAGEATNEGSSESTPSVAPSPLARQSDASAGEPARRVSDATVSRLPVYLQGLVSLAGEGAASVSSESLADLSAVNPATLRRDLAGIGITGTRGVGYDVKYLVHEISVVLGLNQEWPVIIVGVGNLGRALANYEGLATQGFPVQALVDIDSSIVGSAVAGVVVEHFDDISAVVAREAISVGVIATPAAAAQEAAQHLIDAGLASLLNFTPVPVVVPDHVQVRGVDLATELQILSFYQQRSTAAARGTGLPLGTP